MRRFRFQCALFRRAAALAGFVVIVLVVFVVFIFILAFQCRDWSDRGWQSMRMTIDVWVTTNMTIYTTAATTRTIVTVCPVSEVEIASGPHFETSSTR